MSRIFYFSSNLILALIFFLNIMDPFFYEQYGTRSNLMVSHAAERTDIILPMIWKSYPVVKVLLAFTLLMYLFIRLHSKIYPQVQASQSKIKWVLSSLLTLLLLSFIYYGPPFWTLTSFSPYSVANQMSGNGVYTLIKSYDMERQFDSDIAAYDYGDTQTAIQNFKAVIIQKDETALNDYYPTLRKFTQDVSPNKKNVVVIIMESFGASNIGILGGKNLSPNFDRYSKQGMLFTNCFSNGVRTQHGVTAIVASFPPLLGSSLIRRKGISDFNTIGNCMLNAGYSTSFLHNGHADYDDMDLFLKQGGFQKLSDITDYTDWKFKNEWGVSDEDLYKKALLETPVNSEKPHFTVLLTMSNHGPYEVPADFAKAHPEIKSMHVREAAFYYSDYALGEFLDNYSKRPDFKNTIFLITADHGEVFQDSDLGFKYFHIPALILNSSQVPGKFEKTCSQVDLPLAILSETGYDLPFHLAGQNPFSSSYLPFSFSKDYESTITLCKDSVAMQWDIRTDEPNYFYIDSTKHLSDGKTISPSTRSSMKQFTKDYLQSISYIYRYGRYKLK